MFEYTLSFSASSDIFLEICAFIEKNVNCISKHLSFEYYGDISIMEYTISKGKIKIYDDYIINCIYAESDFEINFSDYRVNIRKT